jgi:hypothetical protein
VESKKEDAKKKSGISKFYNQVKDECLSACRSL